MLFVCMWQPTTYHLPETGETQLCEDSMLQIQLSLQWNPKCPESQLLFCLTSHIPTQPSKNEDPEYEDIYDWEEEE